MIIDEAMWLLRPVYQARGGTRGARIFDKNGLPYQPKKPCGLSTNETTPKEEDWLFVLEIVFVPAETPLSGVSFPQNS